MVDIYHDKRLGVSGDGAYRTLYLPSIFFLSVFFTALVVILWDILSTRNALTSSGCRRLTRWNFRKVVFCARRNLRAKNPTVVFSVVCIRVDFGYFSSPLLDGVCVCPSSLCFHSLKYTPVSHHKEISSKKDKSK